MDVNRIPGMKKGAKWRNLLLGVIYLSVVIIAIPIIPILLLLSPVFLGLSAWRNWFGTATRLKRLPGISAAGDLKSGILAFFYCSIIAGVALMGVAANMDTPENQSASSNIEASGGTPSDSNVGDQSVTETPHSESTTEAASEVLSYSPMEAKDLSYPGTDRVRVSVKLTESRPDITEEEVLLIGKDVVESRKEADEVAVHIYQPEGELGAGACGIVEWTEESGYEVDTNWMSCEDPEW